MNTAASTATSPVDVLVVGAGPVGLFLASECVRRALRCRIVEQRPRQSEHSKALAIMPRTLEIFDMAGVVAPFLEAANRVTSVALVTHGHRLGRIRFEPADTPYPFVAMVPQDVTEARSRFVLVLDADGRSQTAAAARRLTAEFPDVLELRSGMAHGITLVRPDGYAAFESHHGSPAEALAAVREVLERQVVGSTR